MVCIVALAGALNWATGGVAEAAGAPACTARALTSTAGPSGSGMSQPYVTVILTNSSARECTLRGYPDITAMSTKKGSKSIDVKRGNFANISSGVAGRFTLAPGARAWFAVGAATAYDPPLVTFTTITYAIGGASRSAAVALQATAPKGSPFPIGVTAFAAGIPPRNS